MQYYGGNKNIDPKQGSESETNSVLIETSREMARRLARERGIRGDRIREILLNEFPTRDIPLARQINRWIEDIPNPNLKKGDKRKKGNKESEKSEDSPDITDLPYEYGKSKLPDELKGYVHRLEILKAAMFKGDKLTNREAKLAKRTFVEFQDPYGEQIDLIAQYAVLWELAERKARGKEVADIEDLFAFAPWRSDKHSKLYQLALEKKLIKSVAMLRLIAPLLTPGSGDAAVPNLFMGAHAHLNLPYLWSWIQEYKDGERVFAVTMRDNPTLKQQPEKTDAEALKERCNWIEFIEGRLNGAPTDTVTLAIGNE